MRASFSKGESEKFGKVVTLLNVLGNPTRLAIVELLCKEDKLMVTEIYKRLGLSQAVVSNYLILLRVKGVLTSVRVGTRIYYSLTNPKVKELIACLEVGLQDS